jgi:hypothetical protein
MPISGSMTTSFVEEARNSLTVQADLGDIMAKHRLKLLKNQELIYQSFF